MKLEGSADNLDTVADKLGKRSQQMIRSDVQKIVSIETLARAM